MIVAIAASEALESRCLLSSVYPSTDTDQTPGHRTLDTLYVDQMFIRSESAGGASLASLLLEEEEESSSFSV